MQSKVGHHLYRGSGAPGCGCGQASELGEAESQVDAGVEQTVLAKLMESNRFCACLLVHLGGKRAQQRNNGAYQCFHPLREFPNLCPHPKVSQFNSSPYPIASQAAVSVLKLGVNGFVCEPFKSRVSVFCSPLSFLDELSTGFHNQMLWELLKTGALS